MHEQPPSLPPELWNLSVVLLLCGLMGWMVRLMRFLIIYLEARFAIQQNAVIHLEKLGPSLHVLRHASMWHFHQLLRTQVQVATTTMKRVRVPFEIIASSVKLVESADGQQLNLSVEVKSEAKCVVQAFWNVKTSALEEVCQGATSPRAENPIKRRSQLVHPILPTRAARTAIHAVRSLPRKFYALDSVRVPHQLLGDCVNDVIPDSPKAARLFVEGGSFRACSTMEKRKGDEYVASVPKGLCADPAGESIESSVVATDCEDEDSQTPTPSSADDPHYCCVVAVGSVDFFESTPGLKSPDLHLKRRLSGGSHLEDVAEDEILCQCVAIDFLPTPARQSRAPVIVKKLNFTKTNVYSSQEIFGREIDSGGECVICLENAPSAILLPCRHLCVCRECLEEIDQCPICRGKFSTYACYQDNTITYNDDLMS